jgi:transposase-like protein
MCKILYYQGGKYGDNERSGRNFVSHDKLLKGYKGPGDFYGSEGLIKRLSKALIERVMRAELTGKIGYAKSEPGEKPNGNRRDGKSSKTLRTDRGPMEIAVPRDRDGNFEPQIIGKH